MESQSTTSSSSLLASATPDEIIVSLILLDLKKMMSLSESLSNFNWGRRRKRSCLEAPPPLASASSWPSPSPVNRIEEKKLHIKAAQEAKHGGGAARTTASPDTPLSFSPSESDEKSKHSLKKSSKKKTRQREEYLDMIEALTQRKELLTGEIENVMKYYKKLKAYNSQLKAKKQEVLNSGGQHYTEARHQPLAADQTAQECQDSFGPIAAQSQPWDDGLTSVNQGGPRGFDLNLPAEEAFGVDVYGPLDVIADRRARFAEARRKRIGIIKTKSSRGVV